MGQHLVGVALRAKLPLSSLLGGTWLSNRGQLVNEATKQVRSITRNLDCAEGIADLQTELQTRHQSRAELSVAITLNANGTSLPVSTRA
jgi:hypothetical protein